MKKTICILLALAGLLVAQQGGRGLAALDHSRSGAAEKSAPLSRFNLNSINSGQKSHFNNRKGSAWNGRWRQLEWGNEALGKRRARPPFVGTRSAD